MLRVLTMDDRELLKRAAKAAGIGWDRTEECWYGDPYVRKDWNPLTDDGDAFRLAVHLGFAVSVEYQVGSTAVLWGPPMGTVREPHGTDPLAATRRAIVRAAAAIADSEQT